MKELTATEAREKLDRLASWGIVESFEIVGGPRPYVYVLGVPAEDDPERVLALNPHGLRGFLEGVAATHRAAIAMQMRSESRPMP